MPKPLVNRARRLYGAHPLHLLLILGSFVVVGYALWLLGFKALWNPDTWWQSIAVWFVGAALVHDLLLFPAYAAADRILVSVSNRRWRSARGGGRVRVINFVRVPLLACGLISLMFFPGIIEQSGGTYNRATGQTQEPFLDRWLILCSLILLLGLVAYLIARMVAGRRSHTDDKPPAGLADEPVSAPPHADKRLATTARTSMGAVFMVAILVTIAARRRHPRHHMRTK